MSEEERAALETRLRERVRRFAGWERLAGPGEEAQAATKTGPVVAAVEPGRQIALVPASEQVLGRLLERMDNLERQQKLIYRVVWRSSAALLGLFMAGAGWNWLERVIKVFGS